MPVGSTTWFPFDPADRAAHRGPRSRSPVEPSVCTGRTVDARNPARRSSRRQAEGVSVGSAALWARVCHVSSIHSILGGSRKPDVLPELSERQRLVMFLRYYADLDYPTIARVLGIGEGTVDATMKQAHARLLEEVSP